MVLLHGELVPDSPQKDVVFALTNGEEHYIEESKQSQQSKAQLTHNQATPVSSAQCDHLQEQVETVVGKPQLLGNSLETTLTPRACSLAI